MKTGIAIFFLLLALHGRGQNLVPNPSFEDTLPNPLWTGTISTDCAVWQSPPPGTADYFTNLFPSCLNCANLVQVPRTGDAYAGFYTFDDRSIDNRECISIQLFDTLEAGKIYDVEFYVSRYEFMDYGCHNVGAYFSEQPISSSTGVTALTPQVNNTAVTNPLFDATGWTRVAGSFIANGTELYLTITNFTPDTAIDTFWLGTNNQGGNYKASYCFVDDISVVRRPDTVIPPPEPPIYTEITIYPIPSNDGIFSVEYTLAAGGEMVIHNALGQLVGRVLLENGTNIKTLSFINLASGVYHYRIASEGQEKKAGKLLISK